MTMCLRTRQLGPGLICVNGQAVGRLVFHRRRLDPASQDVPSFLLQFSGESPDPAYAMKLGTMPSVAAYCCEGSFEGHIAELGCLHFRLTA